jgi:mRNA interferase HigB
MKVHLIRIKTIENYVLSNARSRPSFEDFLEKLKHASWLKPLDMKDTFGAADLLGKGSNRVVFDIAGNAYRMICKYAWREKSAPFYMLDRNPCRIYKAL